jgi:LPXTG-motif cell wall-anchored protein
MQNSIVGFIKNRIKDKSRRKRYICLLLCLSMLVATGVIWELRLTGISMTSTDEPTCGLQEHTHTADCYDADGNLICGLQEHTHTAACYSDSTADVESADVWEATLPQKTGVQADDLVAAAKSQLGYQESTKNYAVSDDGAIMGYTRYGAWYGNPCGAWSAMFVSFCLHYAGVPETQFPYASGCYAWTVKLQDAGLWRDGSYSPKAGDVVFLDENNAGIVTANEDGQLTVIAGDYQNSGAVSEFTANAADMSGYGVLTAETAAADASADADTTTAAETAAASAASSSEAAAETASADTAAESTAAVDPIAAEAPMSSSAAASSASISSSEELLGAAESGTASDLSGYITGAAFADADGAAITSASGGDSVSVTLQYSIDAGIVTSDHLVFTYQLPTGIAVTASETAQSVVNGDSAQIGTYTVDATGLVTVTFDSAAADGSALSGSFTVSGTADSAASGVTIQGSTLTISEALLTAQSDDTGIPGYTIYYDNVNDTGYYVMENGVKKTVYCYNHELAQPKSTGTSGYTRYNYFSSSVPEIAYVDSVNDTPNPKTKQQVAGLLYAGYPVDGEGYVAKYSESTSGGYDATYETQGAVWVFARDAAPTVSDYYTAIFAYGANTTGDPYGHTGDVTITGDGTVTQVNGVYRSGTYTVGGSYDGSFWFDSLPTGVTVHNASTGDAVTSLKSGDSFYFEITGTPDTTISLSYTYLDSTVYYYAGSAVVSAADATTAHPEGSKYQNFIRMEATKTTGSLSLSYTSPPGDTTGPKTSVTVTKTWSDGAEAHAADSVTVHLYADGVSAGASATLNAANSWTYTFSGLPYYKSDGTTPIVYTVVEDAVANFTAAYTTTSTTGPTVTVSSNTVTSFTDGQYYSISTGTTGYAMAVAYTNGAYSLASKRYDPSDTSQLWKAVAGSLPEGYNGTAPNGWFYLENVKYPSEWLYFYFSSNTKTSDEAMTVSDSKKTAFTISSSGKLYTMHYYSGSYGAGWYYKSVTINRSSVGFSFAMEGNTIPGTTLTTKSATIADGLTAITVTNTSAGYTLPSTGGSGLAPFILAGLTIMLIPAAILNVNRKKKRTGGGSP